MNTETPFAYKRELFLSFVMAKSGIDVMLKVEAQPIEKLTRDIEAWWENEKYVHEARDLRILALFEEYGIANDHYREVLTRGY